MRTIPISTIKFTNSILQQFACSRIRYTLRALTSRIESVIFNSENGIRYIIAAILLIANFAIADNSSLQAELQSEYGNCYGDFANNLQSCTPSSCTYPDLTDAKSWKAQVINGVVNNTCYVMYYTYLGQSITSDPDHCFYDKDTQALLVQLYRKLFSSGDAVDILNIKEKIQYLTYSNCKKRDAATQATAATKQ